MVRRSVAAVVVVAEWVADMPAVTPDTGIVASAAVAAAALRTSQEFPKAWVFRTEREHSPQVVQTSAELGTGSARVADRTAAGCVAAAFGYPQRLREHSPSPERPPTAT